MSKALICSDLHVHDHKGQSERLLDCLKVLDWIFDVAEQKDVDYIFFLGDLFQERSKIDVLNYIKTCELFMKHMITQSKPHKVYLLVGNHDMYHLRKWDVNSIKPLTAINKVFVVDKPETILIDRCKIDWMPHTEEPRAALQQFTRQEGLNNILLGHMAISGAMLNTFYGIRSDTVVEHDSEMQPLEVGDLDKWDRVFLGHYHAAQQLNDKVEYVGSPLELSFGEAFQEKHVIILDLETLEKEYVNNDFSPKHLIVNTDDLEHRNYDLNYNFVRVVTDSTSKIDVIDIRNKVLEEYHPASIEFRPKERRPEEDRTLVQDAKDIMSNHTDMLEAYVSASELPPHIDKKKLLEIGKKICLTTKTSS